MCGFRLLRLSLKDVDGDADGNVAMGTSFSRSIVTRRPKEVVDESSELN